jgi:hypothetical protein
MSRNWFRHCSVAIGGGEMEAVLRDDDKFLEDAQRTLMDGVETVAEGEQTPPLSWVSEGSSPDAGSLTGEELSKKKKFNGSRRP